MKHYFHNVPGRLRVRIAAIKVNPLIGNQIREQLTQIRGVTCVSIRATTGSVIIAYNPQILDPNQILDILVEHEFVEPTQLATNNPQLDTVVYRAVEVVLKAALSQTMTKMLNRSFLSKVTPSL
jgi:hypothetical protein